MKLLFVHDAERLKEDKDGNFYTDGAYSIEAWNRYFSISNDLSVVFRKDKKIYDIKYAKEKFNPVKKGIKFIESIDRTASVKAYFSVENMKLNNKIIERAVLDCDCLIVRLPCEAGYTAIKYAKKYNKTYLIEVVGCIWDAYWNYSFKGKILAFPSYVKMRYYVENSKYAIYVTEEFLQKRYPCNGITTNCSNVALIAFDEKTINERLAKINMMDNSGPIIIGTMAALDVRYKGQQYIIAAISRLNKQGYNFEYQLLGNGDNSYLQSVAEKYGVTNKVNFLGSYPHEKIYEWLDSIDIYAQPSRQEGLPRALIEAMSRGCPSIGSTTAGIPELLSNDVVFGNGKINEICNILRQLNNEKMVKLSQVNYNKSKEFDSQLIEFRRQNIFSEYIKSVKSNC